MTVMFFNANSRRWGILLPIVLGTASLLTHVLFKGSLVLKGPCPNCMTNNSTYFGEVVMAAAGNHGQNTVSGGEVQGSHVL